MGTAKGEDIVGTIVPIGPAISWQAMERRAPIVIQGPAPADLAHTYTRAVPLPGFVPLPAGAKPAGWSDQPRRTARYADGLAYRRVPVYGAAFAVGRADLYEDLQVFTGQLLRQEEEYRRRLARDLHDGLAPILVSAYGILQKPDATDADLQKATGMLRKAIQETRGIIGSVRPATLEDLGLAGAISSITTELAAEADWEVTEDIDAVTGLRSDAEAALYRATVEALQNARVHAAATRVTVKLKQDEAYLEIVVQDNGHGFADPWGDTTVRPGHFGLLGMRERIALLGGVCKISSTPGEGTTIRITVPRDRLA